MSISDQLSKQDMKLTDQSLISISTCCWFESTSAADRGAGGGGGSEAGGGGGDADGVGDTDGVEDTDFSRGGEAAGGEGDFSRGAGTSFSGDFAASFLAASSPLVNPFSSSS